MISPICSQCGTAHAPEEICDPRLGSRVDGKYEILRVLGEGGMGKVYEARHARIGRRVAVKFLLPQYASKPEILRRFENEARAAGSLEHENIAAVHDFGCTSDGACFLVMEFLTGEDCEHLFQREGPLPVGRVVDILLQVCRGLESAHRAGIVHRDLKPANVFLCKRADGSTLAKVLDFGIAKLRVEAGGSQTATGISMGTAYYMSPEQARGEKSIDHRTDVYALGVILYELLSGRKPHDGETYLQIIYSILTNEPQPLASIRPDLPAGLTKIVARAMSPNCQDRYGSVLDLAEALIPYASGPVGTFAVREVPDCGGEDETQVAPGTLTKEEQRKKLLATSTAGAVSNAVEAEIGQNPGRKSARWLVALGALVALLVVGVAAFRLRGEGATQPVAAVGMVQASVLASSSGSAQAAVPTASATSPDAVSGVATVPEKAANHGGKVAGSATSRDKKGADTAAPPPASIPKPQPPAPPPATERGIQIDKSVPM